MTAQELGVIRSVLVASKMVDQAAPDQAVLEAHLAALASPDSANYKATLAAHGVQAGPSWFVVIGLVGGAIALYYIWQNYQRSEVIDARDYPDPEESRHQLRGVRSALGALQSGSTRRMGNCRTNRLGRLGAADKYEFEPEIRLEGYRHKARRK